MIDSHTHILNEYYDDIDSLVIELQKNNIYKIINCADSISTTIEIINTSKKYNKFMYPAIGIHPENEEELKNVNELEELIKNNKIYAIGEIGLDYHYETANKEIQKELFNKQLDLAEKYNLPIIVHTRESIQDCYDILKNRKLKGVIHCYSGSYEMAIKFIKLGYKLGIGGVITFKNSKLSETISKIDISNLLIETDSPYLSPEPLRGTKNNPYNVYYVAKKLSEIYNISIDEVISITRNNAEELFDI